MLDDLLQDLQRTSLLSNILLALAVIVAVYCVYAFHKRQDFSNIPPGPKPWPMVGNLGGFLIPSFVSKRFAGKQDANVPKKTIVMSPQVGFMEQAKVYGNIYSIFIGSQLVVVLNGYDVVRDALSNHADVFSDRPDIPSISIMTKRKGIVFAPYGPVWRQQRKFCHTKLRGFGFGTLSLEPSILQGLAVVKSELLRLNDENGNEGVDLTPMISNAVSNVICSVSLGQRFHHEDQEFRTLLDLMARGLEISVNSPAVLINVFPFLYYFPFGVFKELRRVESDITAFLKNIIVKHKETLDPANPRDLIDMYLVEIQAQESSGEKGETSFSEDYLFYIIGDLFIAGTDTTTNSILWILLYMVLYPEVQGRVQAEMDQVLGPGSPPSLSDRGRLPYTEATIMEVQRMTVVVPLAIPHMASDTKEFRGYTIPKGTVIVPNLWSVHRDPTVWDQPDLFNPERFLDDQGRLNRTEHFMPFGIGRRVCMGEQLAKMELFLMITSLLQAFRFSLPPGKAPPSLDGRFGLTLAPSPYTVRVIPRH